MVGGSIPSRGTIKKVSILASFFNCLNVASKLLYLREGIERLLLICEADLKAPATVVEILPHGAPI
jgi:hypothetical protein